MLPFHAGVLSHRPFCCSGWVGAICPSSGKPTLFNSGFCPAAGDRAVTCTGILRACAVLGLLLGWLGGVVPLLSQWVSFLSSPLKNRQLNVGFTLSFTEKPLFLAAVLRLQRVFALWVLAGSLLLQHPRQSGHPRGDCCVCQGGERRLPTALPFWVTTF